MLLAVLLFGMIIAVALPALWMQVQKIEAGLALLQFRLESEPPWRKI